MEKYLKYLKQYESKEIIKRYVKKNLDYSLPSSKALEINSAFIQGREYLEASQISNISVKPLLQYYGVVSLSRALILALNTESNESNLKPSHGLRINDSKKISCTNKIENIELISSNGTFHELIKATQNISALRRGVDKVNCHIKYDIPKIDIEINFRELSLCFPDLNHSVHAWLDDTVTTIKVRALSSKEIELEGPFEEEKINNIFPKTHFPNLEIDKYDNYCTARLNDFIKPNICQKWEGTFNVLGDLYVVPPFEGKFNLNDISKMFATSFIFGTLSRYHPSVWNNINKGISNDSILPFALDYMNFVYEKYPKIIYDFMTHNGNKN